jgi:4-methylaminobutanoate oxidase (formaldehyde-forming)
MIEPKVVVDQDYLGSGHWEVDIAGRRYPAVVSPRPLYDPQMKRIHA